MSASIWNPGGTLIPQADPNSQLKSQLFTAYEGQTVFNITNFTYVINNGALQVFVNGVKQVSSGVTELTTSSFSISACDVGDVIEVVGNTAVADATGAAAIAVDAAAAALISETNAAASAASALSSKNTAVASEAVAVAAAADAALNVPLDWKGAWLTATSYIKNDAVKQAGSSYVCLVAHTSGVFATDLTASKWDTIAEKGAAGAGTGDMVGANNLSDVADAATARANLGLGSAATTSASAYATAGHNHSGVYEPADGTILKSAAIGSTVQGYDVDTMKSDVETDMTGAMTHTVATLTDGTTIDWNLDTQQNATVTIAGNRTMNAPTNLKAGRFVALRVVQDGTGGRTVAFNTAYKGLAGRTPVTTAGAVNFYLFRCIDTTNLACVSFSANCEA